MDIGKRIRKIRKSAAATQKELAARLGVSAGYINRVEKGMVKPELDFIHMISIAFRCDMLWILWGK